MRSVDKVEPADDSLRGRVALITGASGGIGQAIALALSREATVVAIAYGNQRQAAQNLAKQITDSGGRAVAFGADLGTSDGPVQLIQEVEEKLGPVEILVSNAGIGKVCKLEELSVEDFDHTLAVNLRAPFLLAQKVLPGMGERGFGRVLFISSVAAFTGGIVGPHYASSKAGLHGLTHSLAARFAPLGVTVNALTPALIVNTGMLPGEPEELSSKIPIPRLGKPGEVGDLALAILSNAYITNQVISIDGGMYPR